MRKAAEEARKRREPEPERFYDRDSQDAENYFSVYPSLSSNEYEGRSEYDNNDHDGDNDYDESDISIQRQLVKRNRKRRKKRLSESLV